MGGYRAIYTGRKKNKTPITTLLSFVFFFLAAAFFAVAFLSSRNAADQEIIAVASAASAQAESILAAQVSYSSAPEEVSSVQKEEIQPGEVPLQEPEEAPPEEAPSQEPEEVSAVNLSNVFNGPLPETQRFAIDYLDDAAFLGDSVTEGMKMHNMSDAVIVSATSMSTAGVMSKPIDEYGGMTLLDKLNSVGAKKIYVMLGANEIGGSSMDVFIERYGMILDSIKEHNPGAAVYVQSVTPVTKAYDSGRHYLNKADIDEANRRLLELAKEKKVFFIDVNAVLSDDEGYLPNDASPKDGVHFGAAYFNMWIDCLLTHVVPDNVVEALKSANSGVPLGSGA
ncbi:MAG: GDSL-type esterase/lipase family protein [Oscillospiraceae bacterium]|jgi:lysophospholipase L1-like esterase|nr:GDSL-type esterase/lipase family protein [Oscillospiraceae bacterium]